MVVVLPAPLGPRKPKTSPRRTWKLTPASESVGAFGYRLTRSATSTAWGPSPAAGRRAEEGSACPIVSPDVHVLRSPCEDGPWLTGRLDEPPVADDDTVLTVASHIEGRVMAWGGTVPVGSTGWWHQKERCT